MPWWSVPLCWMPICSVSWHPCKLPAILIDNFHKGIAWPCTILGALPLSIITFNTMGIIATLGMNDTKHNRLNCNAKHNGTQTLCDIILRSNLYCYAECWVSLCWMSWHLFHPMYNKERRLCHWEGKELVSKPGITLDLDKSVFCDRHFSLFVFGVHFWINICNIGCDFSDLNETKNLPNLRLYKRDWPIFPTNFFTRFDQIKNRSTFVYWQARLEPTTTVSLKGLQQSNCRLLALPWNIRLEWKWLIILNTLAYGKTDPSEVDANTYFLFYSNIFAALKNIRFFIKISHVIILAKKTNLYYLL